MEFLKKTIRLGNSAGVLLPKKLLGSQVKITVVNTPTDIKKEALKTLENYFTDLRGIYIMNKKPIEVLAISSSIKNIITKSNMKISIVPISLVKKDIITKPILRKKIINAEIILNKNLLIELKNLAASSS